MGSHNSKHIIIGAGVSGMSVAMRLIDHGIQPLIIDGGNFPAHKVCGEFFSPECFPYLEKWKMLPKMLIKSLAFHINERCYTFQLPEPARSESHYYYDLRFLKTLEKRGAIVKTGVGVQEIMSDHIRLDTGEEISFSSLFLGTGRLSGKQTTFPYVGMKQQMEKKADDCLHMHIVPGGYFGVSQVDTNVVNIACLSRAENLQIPFEGNWMQVKVPPFGMAEPGSMPNVFQIGDAQARIPPCSGDGLAMGITGGVMAADFALNGKWNNYQIEWEKRYRNRIKWALRIHKLMMQPKLAQKILGGLEDFPKVFHYLYKKMR